jgi:RNA polymerase sigma-70 factor (ECF subfamily)
MSEPAPKAPPAAPPKRAASSGFDPELVKLMTQAQAGDKQAYRKLLAAIKPRVLAYLKRRIPDQIAAEDACQTVLLKIHVSRHTFDAAYPFEPWLFAIARAVLSDHRKASAKYAGAITLVDELPPSAGADTHDAEAQMAAEQAFAKLTAEQKKALVMVELDGKSIEAGAKAAGTTPGAFKVRVHRAYKAFRSAFSGDEEDE